MRIDGVYDINTIELFIREGVRNFSIDLRPRSLNFLQHYKLIEMLSKFKALPINWYLHFSNEAEFVIYKFLADVEKNLAGAVGSKVYLEFSDDKELSWYEQFNTEYFIRMSLDKKSVEKLGQKSSKCSGLILESSQLMEQMQSGELETLVAAFLKTEFFQHKRPSVFVLKQWDEEIFEEMYLSVDCYSYPLSRRFESSYRNIDARRVLSAIRMVN